MIWVLEAFNTDSRYRDDIRYREYTSSKKKAELFDRIPKIQFTDSGHGIVFSARERKGRRQLEVRTLWNYVREHMQLLEALDRSPLLAKRIEELEGDRNDWQGKANALTDRFDETEQRVAVLETAAKRVLACFDSQRKWEAEAQGHEEEAALDALEAVISASGEGRGMTFACNPDERAYADLGDGPKDSTDSRGLDGREQHTADRPAATGTGPSERAA